MKRNIVLLVAECDTRHAWESGLLSFIVATCAILLSLRQLHPAFACASHVPGNRDEHLVHAICFHCIRLKNGYRLPQKRIFQNIIINFNIFNFIFQERNIFCQNIFIKYLLSFLSYQKNTRGDELNPADRDSRIIKRATWILEKSCKELDKFVSDSTDSI